MNYLNQIQQGIDFIETYLEEDIALTTVAGEAGLSQWHYQRIFKALTKETLKTYIRSRRLANALEKLLETRLGILDIAILAGYNSQEAFTRAFKEHYAMTPNEFRQRGRRNLIVRKLKMDEDYLRHVHQNVEHVPELGARPPMLLVGMHSWLCQSAYRHNGGPDLEIYDASFDPLSARSQMRYAIPIA
ncbi:helix-turn-helix domain-containing protein [Rugamonas sp. A1-17]|nr:helix-turn-helix domain-containing protein [Rugamonas sp. A1-17]